MIKLLPEAPIGVFDSGLGGLTVVRELRRQLPNERIFYFGDIARLPYGIKSEKQIREFSVENTEFLLRRKVKAIIVACHSSSSAAYNFLQNNYSLPIVDVIEPAAERALAETKSNRIGIIATQATVHSGAYEKAIGKLSRESKVFLKACPLLVPFVEEGVFKGQVIDMVLKRYLDSLAQKNIDTLILGCTHYPMLRDAIQRAIGARVKLIDSAPAAVGKLKQILQKRLLLRSEAKKGSLHVFVSDMPRNFQPIGERFLGEPLKDVKVVRFKAEVRVNGKWTL